MWFSLARGGRGAGQVDLFMETLYREVPSLAVVPSQGMAGDQCNLPEFTVSYMQGVP